MNKFKIRSDRLKQLREKFSLTQENINGCNRGGEDGLREFLLDISEYRGEIVEFRNKQKLLSVLKR